MTTVKQTKLFFLTDELLRLIQIVAIIMAIGVFIDTTRTAKAESRRNSDHIEVLERDQAVLIQNSLRMAEILSALELRVSNHEIEDAAVNETVKRNTQIIDKHLLEGCGPTRR
jgi:hypothetical protein